MKKHLIKILGISTFVYLALGSASSQEQQQAYVNQLREKCASFGFRYGTEGMANCVSQQAAANASQPRTDWFKKSQCYSTGRFDC